MNCFDRFAFLRSATYVWLIRDNDQEKTSGLQAGASGDNVIEQDKILAIRRWKWATISNDCTVENSVAIEENRASLYFTLSHFVSATLRSG